MSYRVATAILALALTGPAVSRARHFVAESILPVGADLPEAWSRAFLLFLACAAAGALVARVVSRSPPVVAARIVRSVGVGLGVVATLGIAAASLKGAAFPDPDHLRATAEVIWSEGASDANPSVHITSTGWKGCIFHVDDARDHEVGDIPCGQTLWRIPSLRLWVSLGRFSDRAVAKVAPAFDWHDVTLASFSRRIAPPRSWTLLAVLGTLLAIASVARRDRTLRDVLGWPQALREGRIVLVNPRALLVTYRQGEGDVVPLAEAHDRYARRRLERWSLASAVLLLMSASLGVATAAGFLCW